MAEIISSTHCTYPRGGDARLDKFRDGRPASVGNNYGWWWTCRWWKRSPAGSSVESFIRHERRPRRRLKSGWEFRRRTQQPRNDHRGDSARSHRAAGLHGRLSSRRSHAAAKCHRRRCCCRRCRYHGVGSVFDEPVVGARCCGQYRRRVGCGRYEAVRHAFGRCGTKRNAGVRQRSQHTLRRQCKHLFNSAAACRVTD